MAEGSHEFGQFGAVAAGAGDLLAIDLGGAGLLELIELAAEVLVVGAAAGVSDDHDSTVSSLANGDAVHRGIHEPSLRNTWHDQRR